jgi:membrane associated rhomboid family serine protease
MPRKNRSRPPLVRREVERLENEPGYAAPSPWNLRGMLTLALIVVVLQTVVSLVTYELRYRNDPTDSLAFHALNTDPVSMMLFTLVGMPFARRLAQQRRPMRILETLSAGAVMYILDYLSISIAISLSGHAADAHDGKQMAGAAVAAVLGIATGSALFGVIYRRLWMPRLPGAPKR